MTTATDLQKLYADSIAEQMRYKILTAPMAEYNIGVLGRQRDRSLNDSRIKFERGKASLFSPVAAAGLENSGAAQVHVGNYLADQARQEANILASFQEARDQVLTELAQQRSLLALNMSQVPIDALNVVGSASAGGFQ
mgnify:FL=1